MQELGQAWTLPQRRSCNSSSEKKGLLLTMHVSEYLGMHVCDCLPLFVTVYDCAHFCMQAVVTGHLNPLAAEPQIRAALGDVQLDDIR